jgi:hypothetical protein
LHQDRNAIPGEPESEPTWARLRAWGARPDAWLLAALAVVLVTLVWTRFIPINQSLWTDELFAIGEFIDRGPGEILTRYQANNHVLFSLLAWGTTASLGEQDAIYRLWSVIPSIAAVALLCWWCWSRWQGPWIALTFALLATASTLHLHTMWQARGYGLTLLAASVMLVAASRAIETGSRKALTGFLVAGGAGTATFPPAAALFVAQSAVLLLRPNLRTRILMIVAGFGAAAAAVFGITRLIDVVGEARPPGTLPWHGFIAEPLRDLVSPSLVVVLPGWELNLYLWVGAALIVLGSVSLLRRGEALLLLLLAPPIPLTYLAFTVLQGAAAQRFFSFLVLYALLLVAYGVVELGTQLLGLVRRAAPALGTAAAGALVAVAGAVGYLSLKETYERAEAEARFPIENFKQAAEVVNGSGIQRVYTNVPPHLGFRRYLNLDEDQLVFATPDALPGLFCDDRGSFAFVEQTVHRRPATVDCLERRGGVAFDVPSQAPRPIEVWLVPDRSGQTTGPADDREG